MQSTEKTFRIFLAEDDEEMRKFLSQAFQKTGYKVMECSDGVDLLNHLESFLSSDKEDQKYLNLIVSDIRMPGLTGMEILEGIQNINNFPPMILITSFGDHETHSLAERFGAAAIINKPFDIDDLLDKIMETFSQIQHISFIR